MGHDSAFKDKNFALQCVRVGFIPTEKTDIRDLGPMDEVFSLAYVLFTLISHRSPAVLRALCFCWLVPLSQKPLPNWSGSET